MSDERLRELERRWKETGATQDEAAWLVALVRAAHLEIGRVRLAAYFGHEAAVAAGVELWQVKRGKRHRGLTDWIRGVERADLDPRERATSISALGFEAHVRTAIALGRAALPTWEVGVGSEQGQELDLSENLMRSVLDRSEAVFVQRVESNLQALQSLAFQAWREVNATGWDFEEAVHAAGSCVATAANTVIGLMGGDYYQGWGLRESIDKAQVVFGSPANVKNIAAREVAPWALGYSDPVRERDEARQQATEAPLRDE